MDVAVSKPNMLQQRTPATPASSVSSVERAHVLHVTTSFGAWWMEFMGLAEPCLCDTNE